MANRDSTKEEEAVVDLVETATGNVLPDSSDELQTNEHAHLTLKESLKKWRTVVMYSLCMASAILMYGYDYVIVGTVSAMPSFQ